MAYWSDVDLQVQRHLPFLGAGLVLAGEDNPEQVEYVAVHHEQVKSVMNLRVTII